MNVFLDKKKNAGDLGKIRDEIGKMRREKTFQDECLKQLGYTTNPWEIEAVRNSKASIGEPWVSKMNTGKSKGNLGFYLDVGNRNVFGMRSFGLLAKRKWARVDTICIRGKKRNEGT